MSITTQRTPDTTPDMTPGTMSWTQRTPETMDVNAEVQSGLNPEASQFIPHIPPLTENQTPFLCESSAPESQEYFATALSPVGPASSDCSRQYLSLSIYALENSDLPIEDAFPDNSAGINSTPLSYQSSQSPLTAQTPQIHQTPPSNEIPNADILLQSPPPPRPPIILPPQPPQFSGPLFNSPDVAIHVFTGDVYIWNLTNRPQTNAWDELSENKIWIARQPDNRLYTESRQYIEDSYELQAERNFMQLNQSASPELNSPTNSGSTDYEWPSSTDSGASASGSWSPAEETVARQHQPPEASGFELNPEAISFTASQSLDFSDTSLEMTYAELVNSSEIEPRPPFVYQGLIPTGPADSSSLEMSTPTGSQMMNSPPNSGDASQLAAKPTKHQYREPIARPNRARLEISIPTEHQTTNSVDSGDAPQSASFTEREQHQQPPELQPPQQPQEPRQHQQPEQPQQPQQASQPPNPPTLPNPQQSPLGPHPPKVPVPRHLRNPLARTVHLPQGDFLWDFHDPRPRRPHPHKRQRVYFFLYRGCRVFVVGRGKDVFVELRLPGDGEAARRGGVQK